MSINELIQKSESQTTLILCFFALLPVLSLLLNLLLSAKYRRSGGQYLYSALIYLATLPGMLSISLIAYTLFFTHENLLNANLIVYGVPPLSMGLTLFIASRKVSFNQLPGFNRLSGLMALSSLIFLVLLLLKKLFIGIFFGGSLLHLFLFGVVLYLAFQWSANALFGSKKEQRKAQY